MGLDIVVGWLAMHADEAPQDLEVLKQPFVALNEILAQAGLPPHVEPLDLPADRWFEASMPGYAALHAVRRLAAYHARRGRLPTAAEREMEASTDLLVEAFYDTHGRYVRQGRQRGWLSGLLGAGQVKRPPFQHLLWHSDCEGFYVPQAFDDVLLDDADPQRESIGGMVGSSVRLLSECRLLADWIGLPPDIDPERDLADEEDCLDGPLWRRFAMEAYGLAQLIRGCERSLDTGAALLFT